MDNFMKKIAVLDLDDTLGNFRETASSLLNEKYKKGFSVADWEHHLIEQLYDITKSEFIRDIKELKVLERMKPHDESKAFTDGLRERGYYIVVLTARSWHKSARDVTERWLDAWDITYDEVVLCGIDDPKASIVEREFGSIDLAVDDSPYQLWSYVKSASIANVYIYNMPWNKDKALEIFGGKRINNLMEIDYE